jgi:cytidyltransferase-like protein
MVFPGAPQQPLPSGPGEEYELPRRPRAVNPRVYVGGTFDLFHEGHVRLLEAARKLAGLGGKVFVAVNTDDFVKQYKGRSPVLTLTERIAVLRSCKHVDRVFVNYGGFDSGILIDMVNPDILLHGDDWVGEEYMNQLGVTLEWLEERDIELFYAPYTQGVSSSEIIQRIQSRVWEFLIEPAVEG